MIDFNNYPKQFIITPENIVNVINAKRKNVFGYYIYYSPIIPVVYIKSNQNDFIGIIIGWVIYQNQLLKDEETIQSDFKITELLYSMSGRFVILWLKNKIPFFRLDANGFLPAVYDEQHECVASTTTLIDKLYDLIENDEVNSIFSFPKRRGFLPFGLTNYKNVTRLLPNHVLNLKTWVTKRIWPSMEICKNKADSQSEIVKIVNIIALSVINNVRAIVNGGQGILYLSGGHDSRMVLAACHAFKERMTCETLKNKGNPDTLIASKVAYHAGVKHQIINVIPTPRHEVINWLHRTGYTFYDPLTDLAETARINDRNYHIMDGTGAEITRASNWLPEDIDKLSLNVDTLLKRIRMPDEPVIHQAAQRWLHEIPNVDATTGLDIAKIELIHGCWAGVGVYGHMTSFPTLSPFSGMMINELSMRLPKEYKLRGDFYNDFISLLWPELLKFQTNKVTGFERLFYFKNEIKHLIPTKIKRILKPYR